MPATNNAMIGKEGFIVLGRQTAYDTVKEPNQYYPTLEQSDNIELNPAADMAMRGTKHGSFRTIQGQHTYACGFKMYLEPYSFPTMLDMVMSVATTGGGPTYTHTADEGEPTYYTVDIVRGYEVKRFVNVRGDALSYDLENDQNITVSMEGEGDHVFWEGELGATLSAGAITGFTLDTNHTPQPTKGLTTTTAVQIVQDDGVVKDFVMTGASITDTAISGATGVTLSGQASVGNKVRIKVPTPSWSNIERPILNGNTLLGLGADISASDTAAASRSTASPMRPGWSINHDPEPIKEARSGYMSGASHHGYGSGVVGVEAELTYDKSVHSSLAFPYFYRSQGAITVIGTSTETAAHSVTWRMPNVQQIADPVQPVASGDLVIETLNKLALQDSSAGYRYRVTVVNGRSSLA